MKQIILNLIEKILNRIYKKVYLKNHVAFRNDDWIKERIMSEFRY